MTLAIFMLIASAALWFDLRRHQPHEMSLAEAGKQSMLWVALAVAFGAVVWWDMGAQAAGLYYAAYVMEKSLSVDNLFVFSLIFGYFGIEPKYRHKVLYWGILGAVVMRGVMIGAGVGLVSTFSWLLYLFGAFLVYAGIKMFVASDDEQADVENSFAVRIANRLFDVAPGSHQGRFFINRQTAYPEDDYRSGPYTETTSVATRLFLALVAVELSDVIFAVDSVPVVVAFTQNFTIAFTASMMAVLGLRSLFFLLDALMKKLVYLKYALGFALAFIGVKMLLIDFIHIPTSVSIGCVLGALALAGIAGLFKEGAHE